MPIARWKDLIIDVAGPTGDGVGSESAEAAFWAAALGLRHVPDPKSRVEVGKLVGDLPSQTVWLNVVPEPKTVKNRVHLDVHAGSVEEIEALGARPLSSPGQFRWTVMADPEGQEFCTFVRDEVPDYKLYEIVVDAVNGVVNARWWHEVLGGRLEEDDDGGYLEKVPGMPFEAFVFGDVPEPKTVKNRVHWDVDVDGPEGLDALVAHGATVLRPRDPGIGWHVLADPEGNEFCVFVED